MVAMERAWDRLRSPVLRVTGRHSPIPFADSLELGVWPDTAAVVQAIRKVLGT
jgi:pyruvate/2-oxoglutarate/acetoin dehydrogenase E1 component